VEAIKYVDEVVPQTSRDKLEALKRLGFDVMFVGDDWKGSPLFTETEKAFKQYGVDMVYFPYTGGTSSTLLTKTLQTSLK
jgi:glycerol-3-phosphate cytidylyltransferase